MKKIENLKGRLIAFEGIDGSGISTQIRLALQWLKSEGCKVFYSQWDSSEIVKETTQKGKKQHILTPMTHALVYATDFSDRYDRQILPMLKAGFIVLCERYAYTSFARDAVRGCDEKWLEDLYGYACQPDIVFYLDLPVHMAISRIEKSREKIDYFEAGMDLRLSSDVYESYRIFQGRLYDQYLKMAGEFGFTIVDASLSIHEQQKLMRGNISDKIDLEEYK